MNAKANEVGKAEKKARFGKAIILYWNTSAALGLCFHVSCDRLLHHKES
jgi:hypothetical protein